MFPKRKEDQQKISAIFCKKMYYENNDNNNTVHYKVTVTIWDQSEFYEY